MLTHPRPKLSPDLAAAINADAAKDEQRRKWWSRLLTAHLECVAYHRKDLDLIEIEAHEDAIFSVSSDGAALIVLRHEFALPAGRAAINASDARRYVSSKGWAPLSAAADLDTFPDVRAVIHPIKRPWQDLASSASPLGMDARLLALPAHVARRLSVRGAISTRILASNTRDPVTVTARIGTFDASFVLMPRRLND